MMRAVDMVRHPHCDAHNILPRLWQGSAPDPGATVRRDGFRALVLAAEEYQPPSVAFPGVSVMHAPLDDHYDPLTAAEWERIIRAASFVSYHVSHGHRTLVTCQAGLNRSGIITALAICFLTDATGRQAIQRVQQRRPDALRNENFVDHIEAALG